MSVAIGLLCHAGTMAEVPPENPLDRPDHRQPGIAARRAELGRYLRARRAAVRPADVGLPDVPGRRRTPGLRREEVAQLSGVSIAWYTWLEQGRVATTSTQVIDAIASALRLDDPGRGHLRMLAGLPLPPAPLGGTPPGPVPDALHRMLASLLPNPAYILNQRFDYLAWNQAYREVWCDPGSFPEERRNLIWLMLTDTSLRKLLPAWEDRARALLAQFRTVAGRYPDDVRIQRLVTDLNASSPEFRDWWPRYTVGKFTSPEHVIQHPAVGTIAFDLAQLAIAQHPGWTLILQTPVTDTDRGKLARLRPAAG
jgi:transcriptional regulator with XRE-family HTH domain